MNTWAQFVNPSSKYEGNMKGIFFNLCCMFTKLKLYESLSPPNPLLISFLYKLLVQCSTPMIEIVKLSLPSVSDHLWLTLHIKSINQSFLFDFWIKTMHELSKLWIIFHIAASVILYYETNPYENSRIKWKYIS